MAKHTACWANLDFEAELSGDKAAQARDQSQRWQYILRLLPEARDSHCLDPHHPTVDRECDGLVAWGVTPRSIQLSEQMGGGLFPNVGLVEMVNDKRFSHKIERQLGLSLAHSQIICTLDQLQKAVLDCSFDWVLKHPLSYSGRERIFGKVGQISESAQGWAKRKLGAGWSLIFEPWVSRQLDYSMHFDIRPEGTAHFVGWCCLVSDTSGIYRGNFVDREQELEPQSLEVGARVAQELAKLGYWGPVSIDAFRGRLGLEEIERPLVEINARYSFGRLTLALAEWFPSSWSYLWWHPSRAQSQHLPQSLLPLPELVRGKASGPGELEPGLYQLPALADPNQTSQTVIIAAPKSSTVLQLWKSLKEGGQS